MQPDLGGQPWAFSTTPSSIITNLCITSTTQTSGLKAIVAVHSTALGPAAGGTRRWVYNNDADALTDVLRLSRGMTYKNAVAGLKFGGGKAVILASDDTAKSPELFRAFGRCVDSLGGRYVTAEDVGCSVDDMRIVHEETEFVSGLPQSGHDAGGDPSPWTALGCFQGIEAAVQARLGADSLRGIKVAVQGVGHVGLYPLPPAARSRRRACCLRRQRRQPENDDRRNAGHCGRADRTAV